MANDKGAQLNARWRLEINPADPMDTRIIPDDNGDDYLVCLFEKLHYMVSRQGDYYKIARETVYDIQGEIRSRQTHRRRGTRKRGNDSGNRS